LYINISFGAYSIQGPKSHITFDIIGENSAPEFFFVHPSTGDILISKVLTDDPDKRDTYVVSKHFYLLFKF